MPQIFDPNPIRMLLERDRSWSAYALGDLTPSFFPQCRWFADTDQEALVLLYQAFGTPVLYAQGPAERVAELIDESGMARAYLSIPPSVLPVVHARAEVRDEAPMWRMVLASPDDLPADTAGLKRLDHADISALGRLYDDGRETGEVPDFFRLSMVHDGVFFGAYEGRELVAVAGTHLVAPEEGVGAVGNVYTRRDRRGRGLAGRCTGAVAAELLRMGATTVALNVSQANPAARRAYERVGFRIHCPFYEGLAIFRGADDPSTSPT